MAPAAANAPKVVGSGIPISVRLLLPNTSYNAFGGNDRNEMGIPEPTTFGALAAAGAIAVVCRRHRRKA